MVALGDHIKMKKYLLSLIFAFLVLSSICAEAAARFLVCSGICTITPSDTSIWSTTSGGTTGASVPSSTDTVTLDASTCVGGTTCTATMNFGGTWTIQSLTMGACTASTTGCIFDNSVNNNNIIMTLSGTAFSSTGTGTRTHKLGSATYTLSGANATMSFATSSNLTLQASSSTIVFSGTGQRQYTHSGVTLGTLNIGQSSGNGYFKFVFASGSGPSFGSINVNAPNYIIFDTVIYTISNQLNWAGTSSAAIGIISTTLGSAANLVLANNSSISWSAIRDIAFTGSPIVTNSFDFGGNSGVTIIGPSNASGSSSSAFGQPGFK